MKKITRCLLAETSDVSASKRRIRTAVFPASAGATSAPSPQIGNAVSMHRPIPPPRPNWPVARSKESLDGSDRLGLNQAEPGPAAPADEHLTCPGPSCNVSGLLDSTRCPGASGVSSSVVAASQNR